MSNKSLAALSALLCRTPGKFFQKLAMIGNILFHDWRLRPIDPGCLPEHVGDFRKFYSFVDSPDFNRLDDRSRSAVRCFLELLRMSDVFNTHCYFYNYSKIFIPFSKKDRKRQEAKKKQFCSKYGLPKTLELSSCCFSHGMDLLSDNITKYIEGKTIIDAGAFVGDSALSLIPYSPGKILSFEPSEKVFRELQANHERIQELKEKCIIFRQALGDSAEDLCFADTADSGAHADKAGSSTVRQTTVDDVISGMKDPVGLIKADIEGMALKMILGARQTILRDRPILTIAVYHCPDEMFGIPEVIQSWGLKYIYRYEFLEPELYREMTLIAYPAELNEPGER